MARKMISTKLFKRPSAFSPWSAAAVVSAGDSLVFTTGLTARGQDGSIMGPDDVVVQTRRVFELLGAILKEAGASLQGRGVDDRIFERYWRCASRAGYSQ